MSDQQAQQPVFAIQRVYLKDLSLEIPGAPHIFLEPNQPSVEVQLSVETGQIAEGVFQSAVTATVTTRIDDKVAFLVEAEQAGIFEIRNIPEEQLPILLNVVCPNIVYPYLRSNVADVVQRSGFPPIHLAEINFEVLYQQRLQQEQMQQQEQGSADGNPLGIILPDSRH